jgi:hypothetical protein
VPTCAIHRIAPIHRTGVIVKTVKVDDLAVSIKTGIVSAGIAVFARYCGSRGTFSVRTLVRQGAAITIVTRNYIVGVQAPIVGIADIVSADIIIVAGVVIDFAITVIIEVVAYFRSHMGDFRILGGAVTGIEICIIVVIQVAQVSDSIQVKIFLFRVIVRGTIVHLICHAIAVFVGSAISGTGFFTFTIPGLTFFIATPFPTIGGAGIIGFGVATYVIPTQAAVDRTVVRILSSLADSIPTGSDTVLLT